MSDVEYLPILKKTSGQVEAEFGLEPGFLGRILQERDDWSFVIQIHALLESVVTQLVISEVNKPRFGKTFSKLPLGGRTGERSFAKELELIEPYFDDFLGALIRGAQSFRPRSQICRDEARRLLTVAEAEPFIRATASSPW